MNITRKANIWIVAACMVLLETNCGSIGQGFAGYEKPAKRSNKYYRDNFQPSHPKLLLNTRYRYSDSSGKESYFVFYANGFVLKNGHLPPDEKNRLNYSKITAQMAGSYITVGDTLYWGTKAGYMKKVNYYKALIVENEIQVIEQPEWERVSLLIPVRQKAVPVKPH